MPEVMERPVKRDRDGLIRCRVCGCTEMDACPVGCSWVEEDLCSVCAQAVAGLLEWEDAAHRANLGALLREYRRRLRADRREHIEQFVDANYCAVRCITIEQLAEWMDAMDAPAAMLLLRYARALLAAEQRRRAAGGAA